MRLGLRATPSQEPPMRLSLRFVQALAAVCTFLLVISLGEVSACAGGWPPGLGGAVTASGLLIAGLILLRVADR